MSLYEMMALRRDEVLTCAKDMIRRQRPASPAVNDARNASLPGFVDAVTSEMRHRGGGGVERSPPASVQDTAPKSQCSDIDELVHMYGSVCFGTLETAQRNGVQISMREHQALNQALDACIARTVVHWERDRKSHGEKNGADDLGFVARELRKALESAATAFQAIRTGRVPAHGMTGDIVEHSHSRLRAMLQRLERQLSLGLTVRERVALTPLVVRTADLVSATALEKNLRLEIKTDPALELRGDADLLLAALTKLLQNAVQFTSPEGKVEVRSARSGKGRVTIEVEDQCGGLPPGTAERLSTPVGQVSYDSTTLCFARQVVEDHHGTIRVRDLPGRGCIFIVELPAA